MPSLRRASVIAAASLLLLVGCTAAPPVSSPSAAPTPRPTVTSSPESTTPQSRFDVDCAGLVDADELATTFGVTAPLSPWRPPVGGIATAFTSRASFAVVQAGALRCEWGIAFGTDPALLVTVLPAAVDVAALGFPLESPVAPGAVESCGVPVGGQVACDFRVPAGSITVSVLIAGTVADGALETFTQDARALTSQIVTAATAAAIAPPWEPAEAPLAAPESCSQLIADGSRLAALGSLTNDPSLSIVSDPFTQAALGEVGGLACAWSGQEGLLEIVMLPGGAWAWDEFAPRTTDAIEFTPRDGLGDEAATAVGQGESLVDVLAGGTWLSIRGDTTEVEQLVEVARAVLEGVGWVP